MSVEIEGQIAEYARQKRRQKNASRRKDSRKYAPYQKAWRAEHPEAVSRYKKTMFAKKAEQRRLRRLKEDELAERIRKEILGGGWSYMSLGKKSGVMRNTIQFLMEGHTRTRMETLRKLAAALGMKIEEE